MIGTARRAHVRRRLVIALIVLPLLPLPWRAAPPSVGPGTAWRVDGRLEVAGDPLDPPGTVLWLAAGRPQLLGERVIEAFGGAPSGRSITRGAAGSTPARAVPAAVAAALAAAGCPAVEPDARIAFRLGPVDLGRLAAGLHLGDSNGLAVTVAVLRAMGSVDPDIEVVAATGRIAPDGAVLPVGGIGPKVRAAARAGATEILVPLGQEEEARSALAAGGAEVRGVGHLEELVARPGCVRARAPSGP